MAVSADERGAGLAGSGSASHGAHGPAGRGRRSVPMLIVGVLVVGGCALASVQLVAHAGQRVPVLAAARDIPIGHVITAADLREVRVAADPGIRLLTAADRSRIVGRPAGAPVSSGELLPASIAGAPREPGPGKSVVGLSLKPDQFPPALAAGTPVRIFARAATGGSSRHVTVTGHELAHPAVGDAVTGVVLSVRSAGASDDAGAVVAAIRVASTDAETVADAAADGSVSVVRDGG